MVASNDGPAPTNIATNGVTNGTVNGITNGQSSFKLTGNGVVYSSPFAGQGRPNKFYPIDGHYPDIVPEATGKRKLKIMYVTSTLSKRRKKEKKKKQK